MDNDPLLEESLQTEDDNPVLELSDDLKDLQNRIPAYKPSREIAKKNVQAMSGFYCDICIRFMTSEAAAQVISSCLFCFENKITRICICRNI